MLVADFNSGDSAKDVGLSPKYECAAACPKKSCSQKREQESGKSRVPALNIGALIL
jgi:hypothetical protein